MRMLDLFCGVGGWSKVFMSRGWECTGVDIDDFSDAYPCEFCQADVYDLPANWIDSFDAVCMSPPCEEFSRAHLPWLRGDREPAQWAIDLLEWSIRLAESSNRRIVECSNFAARHVGGSQRFGSYRLWGDVPLMMRDIPRGKTAKSGQKPELRSEIPAELALSVAEWFEGQLIKCEKTSQIELT